MIFLLLIFNEGGNIYNKLMKYNNTQVYNIGKFKCFLFARICYNMSMKNNN